LHAHVRVRVRVRAEWKRRKNDHLSLCLRVCARACRVCVDFFGV
jgi:hypothetical protein